MEQEILARVLQALDSDIVNSYNRDKNQVQLSINPSLFNKIAERNDS